MTGEQIRVGFMVDLVAGHVTNYKNLRSIADSVPLIDAHWCEVPYYKEEGRIERFRDRRVPFVPTYFTGNLRGAVELWRGLHRFDYDALFSNCAIGVFFSRSFASLPTLIDFDSTPRQIDAMEAYTPTPDPKPIEYLKWRSFRSMARSATLMQAWSDWAKRSLVTDYGIPDHRIVVNPPGVNLDFWSRPVDALPRDPLGPKRILFVGADFRRKGGEMLLDWFRTCPPDGVELHIVTREPVTNCAGVVVHQGLEANSPRLRDLFHSSDVFVLPSLGECFGIATVEAMSAGLPVVVSDSGASGDIVETGGNGFVVPTNDPRSLGDAISAVLADDSKRAAMASRSRAIAERRFDLGRNARRTLGYLEAISSWSGEQRQRWRDGKGDLTGCLADLEAVRRSWETFC